MAARLNRCLLKFSETLKICFREHYHIYSHYLVYYLRSEEVTVGKQRGIQKTCKMESFSTKVNNFYPSTIVAKLFIDGCGGPSHVFCKITFIQ